MKEDCSNISCPVPNNQVQDYLNEYSLNRVVVKSAALSVTINGVKVTIPEGKFEYPVNAQAQSPLTFQGCQSLISIPIPTGSSFAQIEALVQQMLNDAAAQEAQCEAAASSPFAPPVNFSNRQLTFPSICTPDTGINLSGKLFSGLSVSGNNFILAAGLFSSNVSQEIADNTAQFFTQQFIDRLLLAGGYSCAACGGSTDWLFNPVNCRVRIKDYDPTVFHNATCTIPDGTTPAWDGTFKTVTVGLDGNYTYLFGDSFSRDELFTINGKAFAWASVLWIPQFGSNSAFWIIQIVTAGGPNVFYKATRNDILNPIGVYTLNAGQCCCNLPATIEIEAYLPS